MWKYVVLRSVLALIPVYSVPLQAVPIEVTHPSTQVEFLAVGRPSAIKIRGKIVEKAESKSLSGTMALDAGKLSGTVSLTLDALTTGMELRDRHMKEKYLETAKFPTARVTVTKLVFPDGFPEKVSMAKELPFEGTLDLHGVTKPIQGIAEAAHSGTNLSLGFNFKITVSDFNIAIPSYMGITVADEVSVAIKANGALAAAAKL